MAEFIRLLPIYSEVKLPLIVISHIEYFSRSHPNLPELARTYPNFSDPSRNSSEVLTSRNDFRFRKKGKKKKSYIVFTITIKSNISILHHSHACCISNPFSISVCKKFWTPSGYMHRNTREYILPVIWSLVTRRLTSVGNTFAWQSSQERRAPKYIRVCNGLWVIWLIHSAKSWYSCLWIIFRRIGSPAYIPAGTYSFLNGHQPSPLCHRIAL